MTLVLASSFDKIQELVDGFSGKNDCGLSVSCSPRISKLRPFFITVYFSNALWNRSLRRVKKSLSPEITVVVDEDCHGFRVDQVTLSALVKERNVRKLGENGGVKKIASDLKTELEIGISGDEEEMDRRVKAFGSNTYRTRPAKSFLFFAWEALKDLTILILFCCAALSLGFGIKQHGIKQGWYDGGSIFVVVFIEIFFSAISNYRQNKQLETLSKLSDDIQIEVLRRGRRRPVSIFKIVVGDIVCLKIGDQIPADGLFLDGYGLQVDESSMTGESDHVEVNRMENPFLISGTKVVDGFGQMIVTSVGMNTTWGEMMSSISRDTAEQTPLQARLNELTSSIRRVGLTVASLVLVVLLVRFFTGNTEDENGNPKFVRGKTKFDDVINGVIAIIVDAVTIVVVPIPEGLPLAVTLTLAYSMKRTMADKAMVRKLSACETMGSATTICTDKTGTLTMNQMKVTKFLVGGEESVAENISQALLEIIHQAVGLNTTGSVYKAGSLESEIEFSGSPTEKAILSWAVVEMRMAMEEITKNYTTLHEETFNSKTKRSGVLIKRNKQIYNNGGHVHWKGAAEMILAMCSSYYDINGEQNDLREDEKVNFQRIIEGMAASSLRCIAFAHKEITELEVEDEQDSRQLKEEGLTLIGFIGIKDPCRPGVREAVEGCQYAGVNVKMITGDNIFTAKAIATECGILRPNMGDEAVVEGAEFRNYSPEERLQKVDQIRVMARSSPFDKLLMVQCLKQKGHVVAVTGDGTNDAPALKEADIGLSMGIQGTEVAKQSSDIVIMDDNFSSVVTVLKWGRCVYTNFQKFLQFQLTVNVAALVINLIAAVSSGEVPLTTFQLLWVNLIMDTLGALALATEGPTKELMDKNPVGRTEPLITNAMWRNLLAQAFYQIAILLVLQFAGEDIFGVSKEVKETLFFNTFVLCQVFNEFNARKIEKRNVFKGLLKNKLFLGIVGFTVVFQVVMVEFLNRIAGTEPLTFGEWGVCVAMAVVTWPIGWVVKLIPVRDRPVLGYFNRPVLGYFKRGTVQTLSVEYLSVEFVEF